MKSIRQKMREECRKSIELRSMAIDKKYQGLNLREKQDEIYKKYLFLKKLNKAMEEKEKDDK